MECDRCLVQKTNWTRTAIAACFRSQSQTFFRAHFCFCDNVSEEIHVLHFELLVPMQELYRAPFSFNNSWDLHGDVAQMVERSFSIREVMGSMPIFSRNCLLPSFCLFVFLSPPPFGCLYFNQTYVRIAVEQIGKSCICSHFQTMEAMFHAI